MRRVKRIKEIHAAEYVSIEMIANGGKKGNLCVLCIRRRRLRVVYWTTYVVRYFYAKQEAMK